MAFDTAPPATSGNTSVGKDAKRVFGIGLATVAAQGVTAVAAVVLARTGGPTAFGQVTIILAISAHASDVLDWGLSACITRAVAAGGLESSRAGRLLVARGIVLVLIAGSL